MFSFFLNAFNRQDLDELYPPHHRDTRRSNLHKKGYLKKSSFTGRWRSTKRQPQGDREKARRVRQIAAGIISQDQLYFNK